MIKRSLSIIAFTLICLSLAVAHNPSKRYRHITKVRVVKKCNLNKAVRLNASVQYKQLKKAKQLALADGIVTPQERLLINRKRHITKACL